MPGRDNSGPMGNGSQTGRRMGICLGDEKQGFNQNSGFGRRMKNAGRTGFGRGSGRRLQGKQLNVDVPNSEIESLQNEIQLLKEQISLLKKKITS